MQTTTLGIIWHLAVIGVGVGLFQSPNNRALMAAAPRSQQGEASGLLGTGRAIGQSLSVALAGAVFGALGGAAAGAQLESGASLPGDQLAALQQTFLNAFHTTLLVCAAIAFLGTLATLVPVVGKAPPTRLESV